MKIKLITLFTSILFINSLQATEYYVSGSGNVSNNGLSESAPKRQLQEIINLPGFTAGDIIYVMNGTYNEFFISKKGTASAYITIKNYPGHNPIIKTSISAWKAIQIQLGAAYIEINGLELIGNNDQCTLADALVQPQSCGNPNTPNPIAKFNTIGIDIDGRSGGPNVKQHHIRILNCKVHDFGSAGLNALQADYITYKNNIVYNNCWYTIYAGSGINIYQPWSSDSNTTDYKIIIENNISYNNKLLVPWPSANCTFTDGNGIILDDYKNTQNGSTLGAYTGKTIVRNNLVYNNGGSGIHSFKSTNIDIINNTAYKNSTTAEIDNGEIYAYDSNNVRIYNNILFAETGQKINSNASPINTNYSFQNNLLWGGGFVIDVDGTSIQKNPLFVNPDAFDFRLQNNSPAINSSNSTLFSTSDISETPVVGIRDLGAYESSEPYNPIPFSPNNLAVLTSPIVTPQAGRYYEANVKEFTTDGTLVGNALPLNILIDDRRNSHEGVLHLSDDRKYLLASGRTGFAGTLSSAIRSNSATVISRINKDKLIETTSLPGSSATPAFNVESARGVVSQNGSLYYVNTSNSGNLKGTRSIAHGTKTTNSYSTDLSRCLGMYAGKTFQVLVTGVVKQDNVDLALTNTTANQTEIVAFDVDASISGLDLIYIGERDNGILKYFYNGTSWVYGGIYNNSLLYGGFIALTGRIESGKPTLYGIKINNATTTATESQLVKVIDNVSRTSNWSSSGNASSQVLSTASSTEMYRGISFTPGSDSNLSTTENLFSNKLDIILFPNPSEGGTLNIILPDFLSKVNVSISTISGQKVHQDELSPNSKILNIVTKNKLSSGIYFVTVKSRNSSITKKWVVK